MKEMKIQHKTLKSGKNFNFPPFSLKKKKNVRKYKKIHIHKHIHIHRHKMQLRALLIRMPLTMIWKDCYSINDDQFLKGWKFLIWPNYFFSWTHQVLKALWGYKSKQRNLPLCCYYHLCGTILNTLEYLIIRSLVWNCC